VDFGQFGFTLYEFSGFHSGVRYDFGLLGCDAASLGISRLSKKYVAFVFKVSK
jgi:hypothetical protein